MRPATWTFAAVWAALCIAFAPAAEARRIDVWYDDTWQNIFTTQQEVSSVIQSVLREWEQSSGSGVVLQWRGKPPPGAWPPANNSNIVIYWDLNTDPRACAESCRFGGGDLFCTVPPGRIRLYPIREITYVPSGEHLSDINVPTWVPGTPTTCSLRATLMHHFGHILLDQAGHPANSVLQSPINSLSGRHLWEGDRALGASWFSRQQRGLAIEVLDRSSQAVMSYGVSHTPEWLLPAPIDTPVALAMGDGQGGVNNYAAAYGYRSLSNPASRGIQFVVGDGRSWSFSRQIACNDASCSNRAATSNRPCVVNSGAGADYYLVWASSAQTLVGQTGQPGARAVMYAESHDRGATWTQPAAINGAFTRTGVTCSYDRYQGRVVVAYSGSGEDGVWISDRAASATGNVWRLPRMVGPGEGGNAAALASADAPYLAFDQFSSLPATLGVLSWIDDRTLATQVATVAYHATLGYVVSGAAMPVTGAQPGGFDLRERMRSTPVVNFEQTPVLGFSMNTFYESNTQLRANLTGFFSNSYHVDSANAVQAPPSALQRYTGAASNRTFAETAFAVTTFINPN